MTTAQPDMKVAVFSKPHPEAKAVLHRVAAVLRRRGIEMLLDESTAKVLARDDAMPREDAVEEAGLLVSIGGDGTLLASARAVGARQVPILGVNLGQLGFLTETPCDEVDLVLEAAIEGRVLTETRSVLNVRRDGEPATEQNSALNDVVFSKRDLARLFTLSVFV
ncbi:MAG: NAD(+)/NADH kinase, partial [Acidobacteriota bacterium]|nr:NAD(+)/NADH kinase [Acidobacteriota bacterium]